MQQKRISSHRLKDRSAEFEPQESCDLRSHKMHSDTKGIQEVLCGVQDQEGNLKLLMEEGELRQHLHGVAGI